MYLVCRMLVFTLPILETRSMFRIILKQRNGRQLRL
jgi:hypothetical protein